MQENIKTYLLLLVIREIHPLDPQTHRYCMLASTASAPRVTRCSLGLYWSRDLCTAGWLAGWGMLSYLGQIVRGSEIWWFMTSTHSLSTTPSSNTGTVGLGKLNTYISGWIFGLPCWQFTCMKAHLHHTWDMRVSADVVPQFVNRLNDISTG